jgi:hypothetical protein
MHKQTPLTTSLLGGETCDIPQQTVPQLDEPPPNMVHSMPCNSVSYEIHSDKCHKPVEYKSIGVHDVAGYDSLVILALRYFAQIEQVTNDCYQEPILLIKTKPIQSQQLNHYLK